MHDLGGQRQRRSWPARLHALSVWLLMACPLCSCSGQWPGWPAEPEVEAKNFTALNHGFRKDLSGAVWNPLTRTLWLCRNGKDSDGRLWVLEQDGADGLRIRSQGGQLGEWRGFGDCEGITFASFEEEVVYLIVEGEERIYEVDVSTYGERVVKRIYDTSPYLPRDGSQGAEGITFVPDQQLSRAAFVDASGAPRVSRLGMGGLMFVGHQNGGGVFVFDLSRETLAVDFVGEYRVSAGKAADASALSSVAALEFDRLSGALYVWHGCPDSNVLSVLELSSKAVKGRSFRSFEAVCFYRGPSGRNYEGMALAPVQDRNTSVRKLFLTVDDGKARSLLRYDHFAPDCRPSSGSR